MTIRNLQTGIGPNLSKEFLTNGLLRYYCQLASSYSFHFYGHGPYFSTLYFLCNLQMDLISQSVTLYQAGKASCQQGNPLAYWAHCKCSPRVQTLPMNMRLWQKWLTVKNTLAYYKLLLNYHYKKFYNAGPLFGATTL